MISFFLVIKLLLQHLLVICLSKPVSFQYPSPLGLVDPYLPSFLLKKYLSCSHSPIKH
ncbi:hypothetical protein Hanom_Chr05g00462241 [Helianthus anomalus]